MIFMILLKWRFIVQTDDFNFEHTMYGDWICYDESGDSFSNSMKS